MIISELLESIKKSGIFEFSTVDDPKNNETDPVDNLQFALSPDWHLAVGLEKERIHIFLQRTESD